MVQKLTEAQTVALKMIDGAENAIHNLYILFFNRGAEADGFNYWAKKVIAAQGTTANAKIDKIPQPLPWADHGAHVGHLQFGSRI